MKSQSNPFKSSLVPNQCHEDWDKMTPTEQGKFCKLCNKTVHDLTSANYIQIHRTAQEHNNELCIRVDERRARFTGLQRRALRRAKRFAIAAMLVFGSSLFAFGEGTDVNSCQSILKEYTAAPKLKQRFRGKAMDIDNKLSLPNTRLIIFLDGDRITTVTTDDDGYFDVVLPFGEKNEVMSFKAKTKADYGTVEINLKAINKEADATEVEFSEAYKTMRERKFKTRRQKKRRRKMNRRHISGFF